MEKRTIIFSIIGLIALSILLMKACQMMEPPSAVRGEEARIDAMIEWLKSKKINKVASFGGGTTLEQSVTSAGIGFEDILFNPPEGEESQELVPVTLPQVISKIKSSGHKCAIISTMAQIPQDEFELEPITDFLNSGGILMFRDDSFLYEVNENNKSFITDFISKDQIFCVLPKDIIEVDLSDYGAYDRFFHQYDVVTGKNHQLLIKHIEKKLKESMPLEER